MARVNIDQAKKVATATRLGRAHVRRTSNLILGGARQLVPRGDHLSGSGERRPGQQLSQTLQIRDNDSAMTLSRLIGSKKTYASTVHQGSQPHYIHARGKMLKFEWERGALLVRGRGRGRGRARRSYFFFKLVHHPGNKRPVRYLTTPMHLYGRMHGFRTSSARVNRTRLP